MTFSPSLRHHATGEPGPTEDHVLLIGVLVTVLASLNVSRPECPCCELRDIPHPPGSLSSGSDRAEGRRAGPLANLAVSFVLRPSASFTPQHLLPVPPPQAWPGHTYSCDADPSPDLRVNGDAAGASSGSRRDGHSLGPEGWACRAVVLMTDIRVS